MNIKIRQNNCTCKKCNTDFIYKPEEVKWYEFGTYSDKTVVCPECGCVNSVKYVDAPDLDLNNSRRFYDYDERY